MKRLELRVQVTHKGVEIVTVSARQTEISSVVGVFIYTLSTIPALPKKC